MSIRVHFAPGNLLVLLLLFAPFVSSAAQDNFESHRQKAEAARDSGRADDAIQEYQSALQSKPDWAEGWWYLGTLDYDSNRFPDAIVAFKKLVDLQPQAGPVWNLLGLSEFETKDYDNALPHLQRGIELGLDDNPGAGKVAKYHAALLLVRNGEFRQAADLLAGEFSQGPVPDQIKGVLGLALLRVPLLPEQVDPSKDSLLHSAGDAAALLMQKNADAAFLSLEQMLKDYPAAPFLHYIDAVALFSAQRNADALAHLREQIRITPGFAPAHDLLGQILEREGKFDLAAKEKAAALQAPKDAEAKALIAAYARGSVAAPAKSGPVPAGDFDELARQGAAAQREGRLDEAIQYSRRALDLNPQWEEGWAMLGTLYYMTGRCPLALPALKNSIEMNPKRSEAWALMGICEYQGQDNKNALIHLQHAQALGLAANPTGIKIAKYHIAYLLNLNGEFEQATDLLVNEIGPSPVFDEIKLALGIALLRIPKLPEQLDAAQKALAAKAGEIASLLAESRFEQSWPLFQEMLKQAPDTPFLHYAYGVALFSNSQYADAEAQLREEIRISPQSALPYRRLASIALLLHHPDDALASAQQAVKLAPDAAESRYLAGRAYLELKRGEEAVRELEIAARLAPNSPEVHFNLAKAYARVGQNDAAERERAAFTRLNAMAEQEKSTHGSQTYAGSHAGSGLAGGSASTPNPE